MEKENKLSYISVRSQDTSLENIILCGVLRLSAQHEVVGIQFNPERKGKQDYLLEGY